MTDGARLAATLVLPDSEGPWPALLEALPYRKDDLTGDRTHYRRFAEAGYAVCRVDVRGTGSSEGIPTDEYPLSERDDLATVIDWLATRPWSIGAVGMFGTSYSGFNSLQLAMERPPGLRAIVSIFASDDRYGDDVHYFGGALKALDVVDYPTYMVAMNALPPVPSVYGEGWREEWQRRLDGLEPWILTWLSHQRHDDYWRAGSMREDPGSIEVPTMLVTGWADGYTNIAFRGFEAMRCPKRLLMGPWPHAAVETCTPGPNIDLAADMLRWWDRWLKEEDDGIGSEPPIVLYAQRSTPPGAVRPEVRGRWRFEPTWPPERLVEQSWALADASPRGHAAGDGPDALEVEGDVGTAAWISCAGDMPWGQPTDQAADGARSLGYEWPQLQEELEILGAPRLRVRVSSSAPVAFLAAKLVDVFPDGRSTLVTRGLLNLTHRTSRADPTPLPVDEPVEVELELEICSWTFEAGHRVRLDVAGTDWPNAWSPPERLTLTVVRADAVLELPVLVGPTPAPGEPRLLPSPLPRTDQLAQGPDGWSRWEVTEDVLGRERRVTVGYGGTSRPVDDRPAATSRYDGVVRVSTEDPGVASAEGEASYEIRYPEATCGAGTTVVVRSDRDAYDVRIEAWATEDGAERWRRTWGRRIPRDLQ